MRLIRTDGWTVLIICIDLVGSDEDNEEEIGIDPMLGQSAARADKQ